MLEDPDELAVLEEIQQELILQGKIFNTSSDTYLMCNILDLLVMQNS